MNGVESWYRRLSPEDKRRAEWHGKKRTTDEMRVYDMRFAFLAHVVDDGGDIKEPRYRLLRAQLRRVYVDNSVDPPVCHGLGSKSVCKRVSGGYAYRGGRYDR